MKEMYVAEKKAANRKKGGREKKKKPADKITPIGSSGFGNFKKNRLSSGEIN